MIKIITKLISALGLFTAISANALPFDNADALMKGDGNAIRDRDTGLVWLDFGENNGIAFTDVLDSLNTTYKGWRLPTEKEVVSLWGRIDFKEGDPYDIFKIFGANKTPADHLPFLCYGYFLDDEGYAANAGFIEGGGTVDHSLYPDKYYRDGNVSGGVRLDKSLKFDPNNPYFNSGGTYEISTLLVKDSTVPEPASLFLLGLGFAGLYLSRRKIKN